VVVGLSGVYPGHCPPKTISRSGQSHQQPRGSSPRRVAVATARSLSVVCLALRDRGPARARMVRFARGRRSQGSPQRLEEAINRRRGPFPKSIAPRCTLRRLSGNAVAPHKPEASRSFEKNCGWADGYFTIVKLSDVDAECTPAELVAVMSSV
jgi:hypothetical protein